VASLFVASYATALLLLVGLFLVLDMASNLDDYLQPWADGTHVPTQLVARYYVLHVPFVFLQVAPFVTLVAGLFTVAKLLKHNEAVAALAAGVGSHRLLAPVFAGGLLVALGMFGLRELVAHGLADRRDELRFVLENRRWERVLPHVLLRDLNGSFVRLEQFRPASDSVPDAEVRGLRAVLRGDARRWSITEAARAVWVEEDGRGTWRLEDGVTHEIAEPDGAGAAAQLNRPIEALRGFDFTPELALTCWRAREEPLDLSFGEVRELLRRDPDRAVYQTLFQYHLTFPLANLVLLLVGVPLLLRHERGTGGRGLAAGCMLCIVYFAADFVLRNLGLQSALDPRLAAWLPILFFGSLGLVLYDSMKT
jgi:lipopolysaccharide export system permease protein